MMMGAGLGDVIIPKKEFVKEHKHLVSLLNRSGMPALQKEAKKQSAELKMKGGMETPPRPRRVRRASPQRLPLDRFPFAQQIEMLSALSSYARATGSVMNSPEYHHRFEDAVEVVRSLMKGPQRQAILANVPQFIEQLPALVDRHRAEDENAGRSSPIQSAPSEAELVPRYDERFNIRHIPDDNDNPTSDNEMDGQGRMKGGMKSLREIQKLALDEFQTLKTFFVLAPYQEAEFVDGFVVGYTRGPSDPARRNNIAYQYGIQYGVELEEQSDTSSSEEEDTSEAPRHPDTDDEMDGQGRRGGSVKSNFIGRLMAEAKWKHRDPSMKNAKYTPSAGKYVRKSVMKPDVDDTTMNQAVEFDYDRLANKSQAKSGQNTSSYGASPFITQHFGHASVGKLRESAAQSAARKGFRAPRPEPVAEEPKKKKKGVRSPESEKRIERLKKAPPKAPKSMAQMIQEKKVKEKVSRPLESLSNMGYRPSLLMENKIKELIQPTKTLVRKGESFIRTPAEQQEVDRQLKSIVKELDRAGYDPRRLGIRGFDPDKYRD